MFQPALGPYDSDAPRPHLLVGHPITVGGRPGESYLDRHVLRRSTLQTHTNLRRYDTDQGYSGWKGEIVLTDGKGLFAGLMHAAQIQYQRGLRECGYRQPGGRPPHL